MKRDVTYMSLEVSLLYWLYTGACSQWMIAHNKCQIYKIKKKGMNRLLKSD